MRIETVKFKGQKEWFVNVHNSEYDHLLIARHKNKLKALERSVKFISDALERLKHELCVENAVEFATDRKAIFPWKTCQKCENCIKNIKCVSARGENELAFRCKLAKFDGRIYYKDGIASFDDGLVQECCGKLQRVYAKKYGIPNERE